MGLDDLYRAGYLACPLDHEKISEHLVGVSTRTISSDLAALERREIVSVRHTGRQNIYVLGRWGKRREYVTRSFPWTSFMLERKKTSRQR